MADQSEEANTNSKVEEAHKSERQAVGMMSNPQKTMMCCQEMASVVGCLVGWWTIIKSNDHGELWYSFQLSCDTI